MMRINNLADLEVLVAIADSGNLTAAGRRCGLTTAGVSAALRRLEASLGVRLFERTTRQMTPTPDGERLTQIAREAFEMISASQTEISGDTKDEEGHIRVLVATQILNELIACFGEFATRHPKITVEFVHTGRLADLVAEGIDLSLCFAPLGDYYWSQVVQLLAPGRMIACASPDYLKRYGTPVEPADLLNHSCIVYLFRNAPMDNWEFTNSNDSHAKPNVVKVNGGLLCSYSSVACDFALQSFGIIYIAEITVRKHIQSGALVRLFPNHISPEIPFFAITPAHRLVPGRVRLLIETLVAEFNGTR